MTRIVFSLTIGHSRYLLWYLFLLHSLMLATVFSLLGLSYGTIFLALILVVSFICYCQQYQWLKSNRSVRKLQRDAEDKWYLVFQGGEMSSPLQLKNCVVTPFVVILSFHTNYFWQSKTITLLFDAVDAELFRQLRVYCRNPKTFQ